MASEQRAVSFPVVRTDLPGGVEALELSPSHFYALCGENISENDPCILVAGSMYRAQADLPSRRPANCLSCQNAVAGDYAIFQIHGTRENFVGLSPIFYYLANGGGGTSIPPSYPSTVQILGKGRTSTTLLMNIGLDLGSITPGFTLDGVILGEDLSLIFDEALEVVLHG